MTTSKSQKKGKLKIFIDEGPLNSGHAVRGIGSYTRELLLGLQKRNDVSLVDARSKADIVHYPYFDFFFNTLNPKRNEKFVVTIYDTIPLIYPQHYPSGIKGKINFWLQKRALGKVSAVLTISETSKKDIVRFLDLPQEKVFAVHLAPAPIFRKLPLDSTTLRRVVEKYRLPERFVLYVGDVNYNKNVGGLIQAFALLANSSEMKRIKVNNLRLVLVGKAFKEDITETRDILQLIKESGLQDRVVMPGFIPEEDLVGIYNLATVYCQPSFYEGFGLPVLEAMSSGVPVVASKTQALVEIAEGKALFADPHSSKELASVLFEILSDVKLQAKLGKAGLEHVKGFSWDKVADETIKVYSKVVHS